MNNQRPFVILLIGMVVLGGIAYFINTNPDAVAKPTPTAPVTEDKLFNFDPQNALSLSIIDRVKNLNFTALLDEKGVWAIKEPKVAEGDPVQIRTILSSMSTLFPNRSFNESIDITEFGVVKPDYVIEIRVKDGQTIKLQVGKKDATAFGYYARKDATSKTVLISASALDIVLNLPSNPPIAIPTVIPPTLSSPLPSGSTPAPATTATP